MPPPRFKAVSVQTGRESKPFGLTERVRGAFRDPDICIFMSDEFEMPRTDKDHELCQSTGLTDSRGVEVFEGDVLACKCHADIAVVWVQGSEPEDPVAAWGWKYAHPDFDHVEYHNTFQRSGICLGRSVIGNKWMPAAELRARAEAVSNGK